MTSDHLPIKCDLQDIFNIIINRIMKSRTLLILISFFAFDTLYSQTKVSRLEYKGRVEYNNMSYVKAAEIYSHVAQHKKLTSQGKLELGNCYRFTGQWGKAEFWYAELAKDTASSGEVHFLYAQALSSNGNYEAAKQQLQLFTKKSPNDTRADRFQKNLNYAQQIQDSPPFFSITPAAFNSSFSDFGTTYYKNGQVVFTSSRSSRASGSRIHSWDNSPFLDLQVASFSSNSQYEKTQLFRGKFQSKYHEGPVCFTSDFNTMYFTRNNYFKGKSKQSSDGTNKLKIYRAKWLNNKWTEENLAINNDDFSTGHPALTNDEKYLVFSSDRPGGFGGSDLYFVSIDEQGNLGDIKNLGASINTEGNEMFPTIDSQGRLFFASDGLPGLGGLDVFYCSSLSALNPQNLGEPINSPFDDFHLSLDSLGTSGYLSSNRSGGAGYDDIYSVKLLRPLVSSSVFSGIVKNETDGRTIDKSKLFLIDDSGLIVDSCLSGIDGSFGFTVLSDKYYRISASKEKFATTTSNSFIPNKEKNDAGPYEIKLRPISNIQVVVLIKDKLTQQPIDSVKLTATLSKQNTPLVVNNPEPKRAEYIVALDGMRVGDSVSLALSVERPGYLSQTVKVSDKISPDGIVPVTIFADKIQVGADLSKIIDIKPIYFDLGKSNIRPDAAKELDKIVQVMNDNPSMVIELGSHTDCRSSASSNLSLSDRRAKASAEYIKKRITNPARITGKGYGESTPINDCRCEGEVKSSCSEQEHQLNRRTEFKIITF